jgi:hypothetical protein
MEMKSKLILATVVMGVFLIIGSSAFAYTIDGSVADWGIDLFASGANAKGYLNSHLPSGGNDIDYITEDNAGPTIGWQYVGPGYSYYGNQFDTEAIYFDNDQYNAYIAVLTGFPMSGATAPGNPPFTYGDIGIDADNNGVYEFGIDVSTYNAETKQAKLLNNIVWNNVYYSQFSIANPFNINSGSEVGWVDFVYSTDQNTHFVLESGIPLALLGLNADQKQNLVVHWTMECGNDYLNLPADTNPVPEPTTLSLLGLGVLGLLGLKKKRC